MRSVLMSAFRSQLVSCPSSIVSCLVFLQDIICLLSALAFPSDQPLKPAACPAAPASQVDGEPWLQQACRLSVGYRGQALMLRSVGGGPAQRVVAAVQEALDASAASGVISSAQRTALSLEMGRRLDAVLHR